MINPIPKIIILYRTINEYSRKYQDIHKMLHILEENF